MNAPPVNPLAQQTSADTSIASAAASINRGTTRADRIASINTNSGQFRFNSQADPAHNPTLIIKATRNPLRMPAQERGCSLAGIVFR